MVTSQYIEYYPQQCFSKDSFQGNKVAWSFSTGQCVLHNIFGRPCVGSGLGLDNIYLLMGYAWPELLSQSVPRYVDAVSTQHGWSSTVAGLGSSGKIAEKCSYFFSHPAIEWGLETSILSWKFQFLRGADSDVYINKQHKVI